MRNICNEEKSLKRYLKNHVSLNLETMVKFLITGMVGFSLTACGGGGGGGGSSDSKPPVVDPGAPKPEPVTTTVQINGKDLEVIYTKNSDGSFDKNILINGVKVLVKAENSLEITQDYMHNGYNLNGVTITNNNGVYSFEKGDTLVTVEKLVDGKNKNSERYRVTHNGNKYIVVNGKLESTNNIGLADSIHGDVEYSIDDLGNILSDEILINGVKALVKGDNSLEITQDYMHNGHNLNGVIITNNNGVYSFEKGDSLVTLEKLTDGRYRVEHNGTKYIVVNGKLESTDGKITTDSIYGEVEYSVNDLGEFLETDEILINGVKALVKGDNSLEITQDYMHNGHNLNGVIITNNDGVYSFEKDNSLVTLEKLVDGRYRLEHNGTKYIVVNGKLESTNGKITTDSIYGEIEYSVNDLGEFLETDEILINGVKALVKGDNSLQITEDFIHNGHNLNGVTITNNDGVYSFEKGDSLVTLEKLEDGGYKITHDGFNYLLDKDGKLVFSDNPATGGQIEGQLPEIGVDKNWDLLSEHRITAEKLQELKDSGVEIVEKDGKYYAMDDNNNAYQLILIIENDKNIEKTEDGEVVFEINGTNLENAGDVILKGEESVVVKGEDAFINNSGNIEISGNNSKAIDVQNSTVENTGDIVLSGEGSIGIHAVNTDEEEGTQYIKGKHDVTTSGTIEVTGSGSKGVYGKNVSILNTGTINSYGIGSSDELEEELTKGSIGILISGPNGYAENQGTINVKNDQSYGIIAEKKAIATNKNVINAETGMETLTPTGLGEWNAAMFATEEGKIINDGEINLQSNGRWISGMIVYGNAEAINNGEINLAGNRGAAMTAEGPDGAYIENNGNILITPDGDFNSQWMVGMSARPRTQEESSLKAINNGTINTSARGAAMSGEGKAYIENNGTIIASKDGKYIPVDVPFEYGEYIDGGAGMDAFNSTAENNGKIVSEGVNGYGIIGKENSIIKNNKDGVIIGTGKGEFLTDDEGKILKDNIGTTGMLVNDLSSAINYGKIEMDGINTTGMRANRESEVINEGEIKLASNVEYTKEIWKDTEDQIHEYEGVSFSNEIGIYARTNSTAENNGTIKGIGSIVGIYARENSIGINNGNIIIEGTVEKYEGEEEVAGGYGGHLVSYSRGMRIRQNSTGINNGNISIIGGEGEGIVAQTSSEGINNNKIYLESSSFIAEEFCEHDNPTENHFHTRIEHTYLRGMRAWENSKIINEEEIAFLGNGLGMQGHLQSEIVNNGSIYGESILYAEDKYSNLTYIRGMEVNDNSYGENNGLISLIGEGEGMQARENSEIVNNGIIQLEGVLATAEGAENETSSYLGGMSISNSKGTNNGLISVNKVYYGHGVSVNGGEFENSSTGKIEIDGISGATAIYASTNSYDGNENQEKSTSIVNDGILSVSGSEYLVGINGYGSNENDQLLKVENNGIINVTGDFSKGIEVTNGNLINTGEINLDGNHVTALSISGSGKLINTKDLNLSGVAIRGNSFSDNREIIIENEGNLIVTGDGEVIKDLISNNHYTHNAAKGIESNGGNIFNSGNIVATGNGAYLEYENDWGGTSSSSSMAAQGIYASNAGVVKNEGDITVTGDAKDSWNGATGIYASGKFSYNPSTETNTYEKVKVENSGVIKVDGDYARGISVNTGDLINIGKIDVTGISSVGIFSTTNSDSVVISKIENEGDITVIGDGEAKKDLNNNYYSSKDAAKGIESYNGDVYNSGNIVATGNGAYLEYETDYGITSTSSMAAQGIYASNTSGIVVNEGDITVTGDTEDSNNGATGIYASGKYDYDSSTGNNVYIKVDVQNSGAIRVYGDYARGISTLYGDLINIGKVDVTGVSSVGISSTNNYGSSVMSKIENEGDITVTGDAIILNEKNGYKRPYDAAVGIKSYNTDVYNSGNITVSGNGKREDYFFEVMDKVDTSIGAGATGIYAENIHNLENYGVINVTGDSEKPGYGTHSGIDIGTVGIYANGKRYGDSNLIVTPEEIVTIKNSGEIVVEGKFSTGIRVDYGNVINTAQISVLGTGSKGIDGNYFNDRPSNPNTPLKIENEGDIYVEGNGEIIIGNHYDGGHRAIGAAVGIISTNTSIYNSGNITAIGNGVYDSGVTNNYSKYAEAAMGINAKGSVTVNNFGNIYVEGEGSIEEEKGVNGIYGSSNSEKIEVNNFGSINAIGKYANGILISNGILTNNSKIEVEGDNSKGIRISGTNAIATNLGTINIDGEGSYGMYAENGATVTNGATGVINVGASAAGGMYADWGSKAINDGTINIHKDNAGGESIALVGNGELVNNGTVTANTDLTINTIKGGTYVIGTREDGSYGKISAKNVSIDGDVVVSAGITKNGFKNEYTMQNVVDAEDIKLGDNFNFTSNSLLYDAEAVTDRWGNLDATLSRNDKTLSDFTSGYITSTANIFGKYQNEDSFKTLSSDAKQVIKAIDTTSVESIDETLNGLTPTIYANLGRQILETSETFKEQDMVAINSLGENSYNFTFIGEYQDVDSRDNIEGYKSKMSGFVGAMNFGDGTFGTIGYGYNAVDYKDNGKGHIQTIHLGLNRLGKYEGVDYNFGIGGEYNFHENKRDIDLLGRRAESDFDSYGVRASGEVSKVFGEKAYVKPYLGLDLAHMKYDSFTESKANSLNANVESENYTSVLPKVGFVVGDRFYGLDLFAGVEYSYELGNMDKEQNFSYEGFEGTGKLPKDGLECGTTGVKAGASYEVNNFTLGASVGKNFGRRDNSFVNMSLGYRF
ncbi:hypothetical protein [Candidatus Cetobacterium colombiensis]|uniref:Autotransporter domain-containing protein n=1 Tax=Candidatus Cetobacterium colombiensis TaxID=3073100 RepID=A0ABU4W969_9FUSO|nr:hypothetical protein [Candidatus Cetobacterium colombiensis]MDX8335602.1 hypothetical protein [Candidatus Cetobacterium colombiensis]